MPSMPTRSLCLTQPLTTLGRQHRRSLAPQAPIKRTRRRQQARCEVPPPGAGGAFTAPEDSFVSYAAPPDPPGQQLDSGAWRAGEEGDSSSGSSGAAAAPSNKSAGRLLEAYDRAVKANPTLTKALTSFVGFAVGDVIAQGFTTAAYDPFRYCRSLPPAGPASPLRCPAAC